MFAYQPFSNWVWQGITRAVFRISVSRETILNLACSVTHPTPVDKNKQFLWSQCPSWLSKCSNKKLRQLKKQTLFHCSHHLTLFPSTPFGVALSSNKICSIIITWFAFFSWIILFLTRKISGLKLKRLHSGHFAKSGNEELLMLSFSLGQPSHTWCLNTPLTVKLS